MSAPSTTYFKFKNVTTGVTYPIITDREYGGMEWHYGSSGKNSPFRVVLPVIENSSEIDTFFLSGYFSYSSLVDTTDRQYTTNNGWAVRGGDEIQIIVRTPNDLAEHVIYNGMILEVAPIIGEDRERMLEVSGISWGDFWKEGSVFDNDYRTTTQNASKVIDDIRLAIHPSLKMVSALNPKVELTYQQLHDFLELEVAGSDAPINKEFVPVQCGKALQEVCSVANIEHFINAQKQLLLIPVDAWGGVTISESDVVGKPKLRWTDDGYHYDQVTVSTSNKMTGPNSGSSPTGDNVCADPKYWTTYAIDSNGVLSDDSLVGFVSDGAFVAMTYPGIVMGWRQVSDQINFVSRVACVVKGPRIPTSPPSTSTAQGTPSTGFIEIPFELPVKDSSGNVICPYDTLELGFQNNFNLVGFFIKLNHGSHGAKGSWMTHNLADQNANIDPSWLVSKDIHKYYNLSLPWNKDVEPSYWQQSGSPTQIDEIEFQFWANSNTDLKIDMHNNIADPTKLTPTIMTYAHFSILPRADSIVNIPRTPPRTLLLIDRTESIQSQIQALSNAEKERVKDSVLVGTITVEGLGNGNSRVYAFDNLPEWDYMVTKPGQVVLLNIPYYGFDGSSPNCYHRVDHIVHNVTDGIWIATLAFGQFNTNNALDVYHSHEEIMGKSNQAASTPSSGASSGKTAKWGSPARSYSRPVQSSSSSGTPSKPMKSRGWK